MTKKNFITIHFIFIIILFFNILNLSRSIKSSLIFLFYIILFIFLFGISGIFLSLSFKVRSIYERCLLAFFLGIISVSSLNFLIYSVVNIKINFLKTMTIILIISLASYFSNKKKFKQIKKEFKNTKKIEILSILFIVLIIFNFYMLSYEPGKTLIPALTEWETHDLTNCWLNCTFESLGYFKYIKNYNYIPFKTIFNFPPNITFGNVALSSTFFSIFQLSALRIIFLIQGIFIGVFLYYIFLIINMNKYLAVISSVLCACNPFILNMQTADRNIIAVMITCGLYYIYLITNKNYFIFGFISGFLISCGLRHIPLIISISFFIIFFLKNNFSLKNNLKYFSGFLIPLIVIIIHFNFSKFQGAYFSEKHDLFGLFSFNYRGLLNYPFITQIVRDPFYSFPPLINNILLFFRSSGYIFITITFLGIFYCYFKNKKIFFSMIAIIIAIASIIGVQSDWMNREKMYPFFTLFFPIFLFFGYGISYLFNKKTIKRSLIMSIFILYSLFLLTKYLEKKEYPIDERIYKYYSVNIETSQKIISTKKILCEFNLFPDFSKFIWNFNLKSSFFNELKFNNIKKYKYNNKLLRSLSYEKYFINKIKKLDVSNIIKNIIIKNNNIYLIYRPQNISLNNIKNIINSNFSLDKYKFTSSDNYFGIIKYSKFKPLKLLGSFIIKEESYIFKIENNTIRNINYINDNIYKKIEI